MQPLKLFFTSGDVFAEFFFYKLTLLDCKVSAEENFVDAALKFEALERVIVCIVCMSRCGDHAFFCRIKHYDICVASCCDRAFVWIK